MSKIQEIKSRNLKSELLKLFSEFYNNIYSAANYIIINVNDESLIRTRKLFSVSNPVMCVQCNGKNPDTKFMEIINEDEINDLVDYLISIIKTNYKVSEVNISVEHTLNI